MFALGISTIGSYPKGVYYWHMKEIVEALDKKILKAELTDDKFVRVTSKESNRIFTINYHNSPNLMREIGRLREISYRQTNSGTGKDCDIDALDTATEPYQQLIVWDPKREEIMGGYRYIICKNAPTDQEGKPQIGTARLFNFSQEFIQNYIPYTIELGRSFVQPLYQSTKDVRKSLFALDNLWEGLGALVVKHPEIRYFFGQVSIYTTMDKFARDLIVYFLRNCFPDPQNLVSPKEPVVFYHSENELKKVFTGHSIRENQTILSREVRARKEIIPPLINTYINTSPSMKTFGTTHNPFFNNMEDTGILISIGDIYEDKRNRYITTFRDSQ